jgi:hypothetical protein
MGLFSTLTASSTAAAAALEESSNGVQQQIASASSSSSASSATVPTVIQLYTDNKPVLLEETPKVTGYTTMTYQAVQVGASKDVELKNRHSNPDLGVWNCHVKKPSTTATTTKSTQPETADGGSAMPTTTKLIDSLLAKVAPDSSAYCLTVDLSDETKVEPNLSLLLGTVVRHLIENPPKHAQMNDDGTLSNDPATISSVGGGSKTKMTSLYDLQANQFGLASEDKGTEPKIEESAKDVKISLMICAVLPVDENPTEVSETAYKKKQARALVIYHLRKFANAINAALCFVEGEAPSNQQQVPEVLSPSNELSTSEAVVSSENNTATDDGQPTVSHDELSRLLRDLAMGIPIWKVDNTTIITTTTDPSSGSNEIPAETASAAVASTPLYGPGRQQEDLIETVLLRNANYPGHWEASKDSLWVAIPTPAELQDVATTTKTGDEGWLTQLRDSIASAMPADAPKSAGTEDDKEGKPKEKDAAVSSFFESLLKNP